MFLIIYILVAARGNVKHEVLDCKLEVNLEGTQIVRKIKLTSLLVTSLVMEKSLGCI